MSKTFIEGGEKDSSNTMEMPKDRNDKTGVHMDSQYTNYKTSILNIFKQILEILILV